MSPWTASSMSNKVAKICTEKFPIAIFKNLTCESKKKEVQHSRSHRVYVWIENCWSQINLRNKKKVSSKKKLIWKGKWEEKWKIIEEEKKVFRVYEARSGCVCYLWKVYERKFSHNHENLEEENFLLNINFV